MSTTLNKLEYLDETKSQIKTALNQFGSNITDETTFRDYSDKIGNIYSNWPKVTGTGESVTLNNTKVAKMNLGVGGNTDQVPNEYQQVDYIESSGTQYINTEIIPYKTTTEVKFAFTTLSNEQSVAGCFNDGNNRYYVCAIDASGNLTFRDKNNSVVYNTTPDTNIHTVIYNDANNYVFLDNQNLGSVSDLANSLINPIALFARKSTNPEGFAKVRIYYCKITNKDTNILQRNYIPCYRKSDNVIGLYDLVNNVFYTNAGTGTFTYGNIVNMPNPDFPQEVVNTSGNVSVKVSGENISEEQTVTIPLPTGMEICKIGTYQDKLLKQNGKWYKYSEIGKVVLNGSETYSKSYASSYNAPYVFKTIINDIMSASSDDDKILSYSKYFNGNYSYNELIHSNAGTSGIAIAQNHTLAICHQDYTYDNNYNDFKNWLSTHNTTVYFALATPTYTEITDNNTIEALEEINNIYSYDGTTTINSENDPSPIFEASALMKGGN